MSYDWGRNTPRAATAAGKLFQDAGKSQEGGWEKSCIKILMDHKGALQQNRAEERGGGVGLLVLYSPNPPVDWAGFQITAV